MATLTAPDSTTTTPEGGPVATVTIYRKDGSSEVITDVDDDSTIYYENLPMIDPGVARVAVKL